MKLIDKDKIVEKINSAFYSYGPNEITSGRYELIKLRNFLDTLEVKEVDLEKELKNLIGSVGQCDRKLAKHFFELGLKTQKGE